MAYFVTTADLISRLSSSGYNLRIDDQAGAITQVLSEATNKVKMYLLPIYTETDLQSNADAAGMVSDLAIALAAYYLCRRRGNTPPGSVTDTYKEALTDLDELRNEWKQLPGVVPRHTPHPAFSNLRHVPGYVYSRVRVEMPISEQTAPTGYTQKVDWWSINWVEY